MKMLVPTVGLAVAMWGAALRPVSGADEDRVGVDAIELEGVQAFTESTVRSVMVTREGSWVPWKDRPSFDRAVFESDLRRIESYYASHGYPDARVRSFDVEPTDDGRAVALTIVVDEGPPVILASLSLSGFEALSAQQRELLRAELPLKVGAPLPQAALDRAQSMAVRRLQNQGYPQAEVALRRSESDGGRRVDITLHAQPGPSAVFGPIEVQGNTSVGSEVVRKALDLDPGAPFNLEAIGRSQRRLYGLDLFELVVVEPQTGETQQGLVPIRVTVTEADHRQVRLAGGYGSEERFRIEASWRHLNAFGGARSAGVEGVWSSLERALRADFTQPYLLGRGSTLTLAGFAREALEPTFDLSTLGSRLTLTHQHASMDLALGRGATIVTGVSLQCEDEDYTIFPEALEDPAFRDDLIALGLDPRTGRGAGVLTSLGLDARRSTAANPLDSRQGSLLDLHLEQGGGWLPGDFAYREATLEMRRYMSLAGFAVLAVRSRAGVLDGRGDAAENVPFFKRYFLGGSTSLRGWSRFQVAPLTDRGLPVGGHSMLELTTELRVPVYGDLGCVAFADAGNVWPDPWGHALDDLRYDAGFGLRYLTPIGPVRADLAFQINPIADLTVEGEPESRHWRLHLSIGQAF